MYAGWRVCTRDPASIGRRSAKQNGRSGAARTICRPPGTWRQIGGYLRAAAARHSRPSSTSWSPPRRTHWTRTARLRGSLAGGSIRSRRPARESGRNAEWAKIPDPSPPFHAFPWFRSVTAARRATGKVTTLRAGASSGRPAEGHRRRWRRVRARWPTRSSRAWQRSDGRNGSGGCARSRSRVCRNSREAARARAAAHVLRGAQRALRARLVPFCRYGFLPPATDLAAGRRGVPALPGPGCGKRILTRAAWCHFIAGDGRRCLA